MKLFMSICLLFITANFIYSQDIYFKSGADFCSYFKSHNSMSGDIFVSPDNPGHSFDVLNYKLNIDLYNCFKTPLTSAFSASNLITFKVDSTLNPPI